MPTRVPTTVVGSGVAVTGGREGSKDDQTRALSTAGVQQETDDMLIATRWTVVRGGSLPTKLPCLFGPGTCENTGASF